MESSVVSDRLQLYQIGLEQAESSGDVSKMKCYKRAIIIIEELLKSVNAGHQIDEEALPPIIAVNSYPSNDPNLSVHASKSEYDINKKNTDGIVSDSVDEGISSHKVLQPQVIEKKSQALTAEEDSEFDLSDADLELLAVSFVDDRNPKLISVQSPDKSHSLQLNSSPLSSGITKTQVRMVLVERRDQYKTAMQLSKSQGDMTCQKRYGIIAVQFDRVIKSLDCGQLVDLTNTPPPPPGFKSLYDLDISQYQPQTCHEQQQVPNIELGNPNIELGNEIDSSIPTPKTVLEALHQRLDKYREGLNSSKEKGETSRIRRLNRIVKQYEDAIKDTNAGKITDYSDLPSPPGYPPIPIEKQKQTQLQPSPSTSQSLPVNAKVKLSVSDAQLQNLQVRAKEYHQAAREAKTRGDIESALLYMRYYKTILPMVQTALAGLPVDLTQVSFVPVILQYHLRPVQTCTLIKNVY